MAERIAHSQEDGIAIVMLPKALNAANCDALKDLLSDLLSDAAVAGIVLSGANGGFASGFDLEERDWAHLSRRFARLADMIEAADTPILAALSGPISDEGIDLALCAHGRVALEDVTLAMSAVDRDLIPGGGATQRLPRLIGPEASLRLMLGGETWAITDPRLKGFATKIVPDNVNAAAKDLALQFSRTPPPEALEPAAFQAALSDARARLPNPSHAQLDVITCVEAAQLLPFEQGLAFEAARFEARSKETSSRLLRHAAMVRAKAREPVSADASPKPVSRVVAMGRSSETADLAAMALEQGRTVWVEAGSEDMGAALADLTLKRLRPSMRGSEEVKARLKVDLTGSEMEEADLIFDTAELTPDPPVEMKPGGVWIVTSPDMAAADRAVEVNAQGQTLRMRRLMRSSQVVELSAPPGATEAALATAHAALGQSGSSVIVTADASGGLLGALFCALSRAALVMLAAGREPGEIEQAARALGLRQGPLQMMDVIGAGRALAQMRRVYEHRANSMAALRLLSERMADVTDGDEKRARRALVFHAPAGQSFARDPDLPAWLAEWRADHPERVPHWPEIDLKEALLAALVSEAARLLQDKVARQASDIDLAAEKGLLMDVRSGGPLIQADFMGLLRVGRVMRHLEPVDSAVWAREPLIDDMIKNGRLFF